MVIRMVDLIWSATFILSLAATALAAPATAQAASLVCPKPSIGHVLEIADSCLPLDSLASAPFRTVGVVEGDEAALSRVLNHVHRNRGSYIAVLFYAAWCPFSKVCRPNFQGLSSLFPFIQHFAFDESLIRPSILSRYGVHGFPILFLLNATTRVRYHGPRTMNSLVSFYNDVTGNLASLDLMSVETNFGTLENAQIEEDSEPESCPFSWARSPEKLLQQDTYLALASCFLILRMLTCLLPKLNACIMRAWRRQTRYSSFMSVWNYLQSHFEQAKRGFNALNPCKRSNLQDGAINARAWASNSLASVSLGEPSTGKTYSRTERR